jgi:hypothetical protein
MRNRWYEAFNGRFLSEDPLGVAGGINQYVFAGNDPVNGADPFGLYPCNEDTDSHYDNDWGTKRIESGGGGIVVIADSAIWHECLETGQGPNGSHATTDPTSGPVAQLPGGSSTGSPAAHLPADQRSFGQCFSQSVAPTVEILAGLVGGGGGVAGFRAYRLRETAAVGRDAARMLGELPQDAEFVNNSVDIRARLQQMKLEGAQAEAGLGKLLKLGGVVLAGVSAYYLTTAVVCAVAPDWL